VSGEKSLVRFHEGLEAQAGSVENDERMALAVGSEHFHGGALHGDSQIGEHD
jgi:hypothetical protein